MAMRIYNCGYHAGHHDTVEAGYVDILSCDMENHHEDGTDLIPDHVRIANMLERLSLANQSLISKNEK